MTERVWRSRLRWRVRGAWRWPTFAGGLLADTLIVSLLPATSSQPQGPVAALLLAIFFQLVVMAALGPLAGLLLRRLRPAMPAFVAQDRASAVLLLALGVALLVSGLL